MVTHRSISAVAFAATLAVSASTTVQASQFLDLDTIPIFVGAGIGYLPDYRGSDDYMVGGAPNFRYTFEGQQRYVQLFVNELSANLIDSDRYRFGPVLNYHFGRDDDVDDAAVQRMEEIDGTVELGLFGEIVWADQQNPRNRFLLGTTLLQDVGDESEGFRARFSGRYWQQVSRAVDLHLGGGFIYADDDYTDHYFGVNADNVGTSGLPFFATDGGVSEYFITAGALTFLSEQWVVGAGVRYARLTGDAADSPIVDDRGDANQWIAGISLGYIGW